MTVNIRGSTGDFFPPAFPPQPNWYPTPMPRPTPFMPTPQPILPPQPPIIITPGLTEEDVRRIIREELDRESSSHKP